MPTSPARSSRRKVPTIVSDGTPLPAYQGWRAIQAGKKSRKCGASVAPGRTFAMRASYPARRACPADADRASGPEGREKAPRLGFSLIT
jgi:hypothetical protein